jgi:cytidyltransferase-like protein
MDKSKIKSSSELSSLVGRIKKSGKTVGLITGCFDIVHIDHLALFKNSKDKVDILIVALENDETIRKSKGLQRPINKQKNRLLFLSAISCIDYVFLIEDVYDYSESVAAKMYSERLVKEISPNYLITNKRHDKSWTKKRLVLKGSGIELLNVEDAREEITTSYIEQKLLLED